MRQCKAWALEEKTGRRKGGLVKMKYVPFWNPVKTAVFNKRGDAIRYVKEMKIDHLTTIVRISITIEKILEKDDEETFN